MKESVSKEHKHGARRVRWLRVCALFALILPFVIHFAAREAIAGAVVLAPNAGRSPTELASRALPPELAERGAFSLLTNAGPPKATLSSWVLPGASRPTKGTIVLLHGVRMDKRSLVHLGLSLVDAGYRVVLVDLRGHGESSGRYLTYGSVEARDVLSVLDSLAQRVSLGPLGVFGFSYGGAVALRVAALDARVRAVVAVSTFSSLRGVVGDYERKYLPGPLRFLPDAWFQGAVDEAGRIGGFDPDGASPILAVQHSQEKVLLIHGASDSQVPVRHSMQLARAAGERAALVTVPGGLHHEMPSDPSGVVRRESIAWFDRWLVPNQPDSAD